MDPTAASLFVSHGAPSLALETGPIAAALGRLGQVLEGASALVVASAHWTARPIRIGAGQRPETIYDFGGFDPALREIVYAAPGAPAVAQRARDLLTAAGFEAELDPSRGFDHGVWTPLVHLAPEASLPIVPLSIDEDAGPAFHLELGRALAPLRREGVAILGSGSLTHNLAAFFKGDGGPKIDPRAEAFAAWLQEQLAAGDIAALVDYRRRAPEGEWAHPTEEHLLPFYVALGAALGESEALGRPAERAYGGIDAGVLAMDAYRLA